MDEKEKNDAEKIKELKKCSDSVKTAIINSAAGACLLGYNLIKIRDFELYKYSLSYKKFCPKEYLTAKNKLRFTKYTFYDYCKDYFNLSRRSVDRFISICNEFSLKTELSSPTGEIDEKYSKYSISALAELMYLSEKQRKKCSPDMGVSEIRQLRDNPSADSGSWDEVIPPGDVPHDDASLPGSMTFKKKKYNISPEEYDCFVSSPSGFTSSFKNAVDYFKKGYLLRIVLYKPEDRK